MDVDAVVVEVDEDEDEVVEDENLHAINNKEKLFRSRFFSETFSLCEEKCLSIEYFSIRFIDTRFFYFVVMPLAFWIS